MFNLFKKKPAAAQFDHEVWITTAAKYEALRDQIKESPSTVIWFFHFFSESGSEVKHVLDALGLPSQNANQLRDATEPGVWLLPAEAAIAANGNAPAVDPLIVVHEHYPIPGPEIELANALAALFPDKKVALHTSLDEPLMERFGVERIKKLLEQMGAKSNESISHAMVTKSIRRAQEKIEKDAKGDVKSASQAEWFQRNRVSPG